MLVIVWFCRLNQFVTSRGEGYSAVIVERNSIPSPWQAALLENHTNTKTVRLICHMSLCQGDSIRLLWIARIFKLQNTYYLLSGSMNVGYNKRERIHAVFTQQGYTQLLI